MGLNNKIQCLHSNTDIILSIRIQRNSNGHILSQSNYSEKVLRKFGHYDGRPGVTPFDLSS